MALLGQGKCVQLLQEILQDNSKWHNTQGKTGCWLWAGAVNYDGYAQIKRRTPQQVAEGVIGKNIGRNFLVHRIAYVAKNGRDVTHGASHLCNNSKCFNPEHIVDEPMDSNNRRKGCVGQVRCPFSGHLIVDLCTHTPPCVSSWS